MDNTHRKFVLNMEPSLADPAWIMPVAEILVNRPPEGSAPVCGRDYVGYSNTEEIQKLVFQVRDRLNFESGRHAGTQEVLEELGFTWDEYIKRRIERKKLDSQGPGC